MPMSRCPLGCYFELAPPVWAGLGRNPGQSLTCPSCHRMSAITTYLQDDHGAVVQPANSVLVPNGPWQQSLTSSSTSS